MSRALAGGDTLLALDNCEHVIDACGELVNGMLGACPNLRVIATSRQPFAMAGEQVWRVEGLDAAGPAAPWDARRARSRRRPPRCSCSASGPPRWRPASGSTRPTSTPSCGCAGSSTACRSPSSSPPPARLDDASLGDRRPARPRQLAAAPEQPRRSGAPAHAHGDARLEPSRAERRAEQTLFRRLAAFAGAFSLAAVEAVCGGAPLARGRVLDLLAALVDAVARTGRRAGAGHPLSPAGGGPPVRRAGAWRRAARPRPSGPATTISSSGWRATRRAGWPASRRRRSTVLELEHDNLRAALAWRLPLDPQEGGRLIGLLWPFWYLRGYYQEARLWLEQALSVGRGDVAGGPRRGAHRGRRARVPAVRVRGRHRASRCGARPAARARRPSRGGARDAAPRLDRPRAGAVRASARPAFRRRSRSSRSSTTPRRGGVARLPRLRRLAVG